MIKIFTWEHVLKEIVSPYSMARTTSLNSQSHSILLRAYWSVRRLVLSFLHHHAIPRESDTILKRGKRRHARHFLFVLFLFSSARSPLFELSSQHREQTMIVLDDISLRKVLLGAPSILGSSTKDSIAPKLDYLQGRLGLDEASLRKIILVAPNALGFSIENSLAPKLDWLQRQLVMEDKKLAKVITRMPTILQYGIKGNIAPKLDWLQRRLDLDDAAVGKMIQRLPSILELLEIFVLQQILLTDPSFKTIIPTLFLS